MAAAESAGIRFISDEIYHGLDYAFPAVTAADCRRGARDQLVSKYFCMTRLACRLDGWCRIVWCGRSSGCSRTSRSRCRHCRRSQPKRRSRPCGDGSDQAAAIRRTVAS